MSSDETKACHTQHAFLVVWGRFAQAIGLIEKIEAVKLKQKKYWHSPQTKVLEFFVATLAGLKHLQDISLSAHPLDRDAAVAEAWEQPGWADYSGVSRTLSALSWEEVHQMVDVLQQVGQPFLEAEIQQVVWQGQRLCLDGDLTGIPVSNTSRTYPNTAFGHMNHEIRLGYQAALVSMESPTYGRLWLSIAHHPGDTVSCTQGEALVLAAEARTGLRPWRRTELLRQRLQVYREQLADIEKRLQAQHQAVAEAQARLATACRQQRERQAELNDLERHYQAHQRQERPTSYLAKARQRFQAAQRRCSHREQAHQEAQTRLTKTQARMADQQAELARLQERLERFEQDNTTNADPIEAEFRLDAGFGTYENVALLIEMGYEVYTKPHSHQVQFPAIHPTVPAGFAPRRLGVNGRMRHDPLLPVLLVPHAAIGTQQGTIRCGCPAIVGPWLDEGHQIPAQAGNLGWQRLGDRLQTPLPGTPTRIPALLSQQGSQGLHLSRGLL